MKSVCDPFICCPSILLTSPIGKHVYNEIKQTALDEYTLCQNSVGDLSAEDKEYLDELNGRELSLDALDAELTRLESKLNMLQVGNRGAIAQYERLKADIAKSRATIEGKEQEIARLDTASEEVKSRWEPEIERIAKSISKEFQKSFKAIGCSGEVEVAKHDDFAKWEMHIKVKFRESESLQLLTNQRQSGGERAVSTVFYLMGLQSMAQAPFRVVDEINQGMDPRNERLVHSRMVSIACKEHTSQYVHRILLYSSQS